MAVVNRFYSSTAVSTKLTAGISNSATLVPVESVSGFPGSFPFTVILDENTPSEEIVDVTGINELTLTVVRGVDSTTAISHSANATVKHGVSARDYREAQQHIAASSGVHGVTGGIVGTTDTQTITNKQYQGAVMRGGTTWLDDSQVLQAHLDTDGAFVTNKGVTAGLDMGAGRHLFVQGGARFRGGRIYTGHVHLGNPDGGIDQPTLSADGYTSVTFTNEGAALWCTVKAAAFATQSTRKSKQDIVPTRYGLEDLLRLVPVDYAYKATPDKPETGLVAEDVAEVYPEAVTHEDDGALFGIDYSKLVPLLIASIQELAARVAALEADAA